MPVRQPLEPGVSNTIAPARGGPVADPVRPNPAPRPVGLGGMGMRPMPVFHDGIDNVPSTGPAMLEKGEKVLDKHEAAQVRKGKGMANKSMESAAAALSGGKKEEKPKKEIKHIETKKAHNGGFIHKHVHTAPEHHPDEEHISKDQDEMANHMLQHMGSPNPGEADADAGQSGIPAQAGASAAPPAAAPPAAPMAGAPAGM